MDKRKAIIDAVMKDTRSPTFTAIMVKLIGLYPENQIKGYDGGRWFVLREKDVRKGTPVPATTYYAALAKLRELGYIETRRHSLQIFCRIVWDKFMEIVEHGV